MVERSHTAGWLPQAIQEPLKKASETVAGWFAPRSDASVSAESYEINLELPGVAAGDIDVVMQDGTMIVRGEKRFESEEKGDNYFFSEREFGAFQRSFRLPPDARIDGIAADFKNGVLKISIPKQVAPAAETRKIQIRTS